MFTISEVSKLMLTNNEIKYITKVIRSLEKRRILLKGSTKKISSWEEGFLNFLRPLMTAGLPLMKNIHASLVKKFLMPLGLTAVASATDAALQKKIFGLGMTALMISNEEMDDMKSVSETNKNEVKD